MRMSTFRAAATLLAACGLGGAGALAASNDAPADAYFGAQKMSPISVRQRIDSLGRAYTARQIADGDLEHDAEIVLQSLEAWRMRYPHDSWLPATTFHLEQLFADVQTTEGRAHALALAREVAKLYGNTPSGHAARLRLAQGFPPFHAETAVVPTPNPYAAAATSTPASATAATAAAVVAPPPLGARSGDATPAAGP